MTKGSGKVFTSEVTEAGTLERLNHMPEEPDTLQDSKSTIKEPQNPDSSKPSET
jgi:hypothetical protein